MTPKAEDALVKRRKEALTAAFTAKLFLQVGDAVEDIVALVAVDHLAARAMGIGCDSADAPRGPNPVRERRSQIRERRPETSI